ncbi:MAG: CDP-glucose 4,6-dehydratase [Culturomica sp.]|jgi:CDP-glucose 4,6-dehydratase|nr:CDP-glucose 4,6-dehydratase [Culturomica sp.]
MVDVKLFGDTYRRKKVLITGNTGFKGSWLSAWLLSLGADVYGLSVDIPTKPSVFEELELLKKVHHAFGDICDLATVKERIDAVEPDFVFHLAAQPIVSVSYQAPVDTILSNVLGTTHVLEALRLYAKPCTAVIITSDKCYDNVEWVWGYKETDALGGKDIYSGSKGAAEVIFKSYYHSFFKKPDSNIRVATARAGNVIGGGDWALDRIVPDTMRSWSREEAVEIRNPRATRPWQHVLEPLSGYLLLGQMLHEDPKFNGESFNFGPDDSQTHTVEDILKDLSKTWRIDPGKAYRVTGDRKFHEAGLLKLNCDKALHHLHWIPVLSYEELIRYTGEWYYRFYKEGREMYDHTVGQIREYCIRAAQKERIWTK